MAYLGQPDDPARCTFTSGGPYTIKFPEDEGRWMHWAASYDGSTSKIWIDGELKMSDSVIASGAIVYPPADYESNRGGWFTIGAYHDADEYYPFAGSIDELRLWHTAVDANTACDVSGDLLNYYWQFNDYFEGAVTEGSAVTATKGPDGTMEGDVWYAKGTYGSG